MRQARTIEEWLIDPDSHIDGFEHQDGLWCIASTTVVADLFKLYRMRDTVKSRHDAILYTIAIKIEMLLGPDSSDRESVETDREELLAFAANNWLELQRIDREMGLSGDFESHVVPFMSKLLGGDSWRSTVT